MIDSPKNLPASIFLSLIHQGNFVCAARKGADWHYYKKEDFLDSITKITLYLKENNIHKGDKIALHAKNSPEWLMIDLAIMAVGAISVPIYVSQSSSDIKWILEHSEAKMLFISDDILAQKYQSIDTSSSLTHKIIIEGHYKNFTTLTNILSQDNNDSTKKIDLLQGWVKDISPDDLAMISYTSGTTGQPKGVMLSHGNLLHSIEACVKRCFFYGNKKDDDTVLSFLPFTHIFEHSIIYGYLKNNIPVYILSDINFIQTTLEEKKPIHFTTVPRFLEKVHSNIQKNIAQKKHFLGWLSRKALKYLDGRDINQRPNFIYKLFDFFVYRKIRARLGGNLKGISSGGAALSPEIMRFFNVLGIPTAQGYGLTETAPCLTVYVKNNLKIGSAGSPLEGVHLKIAQDGEILAKGPNIMQGYYKNTAATEKSLKDGWFHTGDIGHLDPQGFLYITDRKKELLKLSTGKYIAPSPIENSFLSFPLIQQVMVIGNNQKFCGAIFIAAKEDLTQLELNIENIVKQVNKNLSPWERVKKWALSDTPMTIENGELTPTFKKKRSVILKNRSEVIDDIYR